MESIVGKEEIPFINCEIKDEGMVSIPQGTSIYGLSKQFAHTKQKQILLAKVDGELQDLCLPLLFDCNVAFLDITDSNGFRAYQRSVSFLMIYAVKLLLGKKTRVVINHSINKNFYCDIPGVEIDESLLLRITDKMIELIKSDVPIEKLTLSVSKAIKLSEEWGLYDKVSILRYRRSSTINFYKINDFYNYFYGHMVPSTGYIESFKLTIRQKGFVLQFPSALKDYEIADLPQYNKIGGVLTESSEWAHILKVDTVGALNDVIASGGLNEIMWVSEALHEKKIAYIADTIKQQSRSIVLVAGPSSSGKTTFAQRLCIQLRVNGLKPYAISLDNYFVDRNMTPRDSDGNYDFECIEAIDTKQINADLSGLLEGKTVSIPKYNFIEGRREFSGKNLKLTDDSILVIEGIHGLNEIISGGIPKNKKFKIFISALTQLNIDDHNRIPTTDARLIRRIVRDNRSRGVIAKASIRMWPSVLRGEINNIFPFQEEADVFFNSSLIYEMCVLKHYVEPLLFEINKNEPEYTEAKRLIKFLDYFLSADSENVCQNSILREFIGGSCFHI